MKCRYQECHQPATYTTPLGTPYCAEHGVCRCGRPVSEFVQYYDIYVCPCIVAFAQAAAREQELRAARQEVLL